MMIFLLLLSFIFTSCEILNYREVTVCFPSEHFWESESGVEMWYTLEYFDGESIKRKTLNKGERQTTVSVLRGATCYFVSRPENQYHPFGGGFDPEDDGVVYLTQKEGFLADILIEASRLVPSQASSFSYKYINSRIEYPFNEDALLLDLRNGSFSHSSYSVKSYKIPIEGLPGGRYIPETDYDSPFYLDVGEEKTLFLYPGIHRYLNLEKRFIRTIAINSDGSYKCFDTPGAVF